MSGETGKDESGWTVDTLRQHFYSLREADQRAIDAALVSAEKAVAAALAASKEAVNKAEVSTNKSFEAANGVKTAFADDLGKKLDRTEYESNHKALEDKIDGLTNRMNLRDGRTSGLSSGWGILVGAVGLASAVVGIIIGTR